MGDRLSTGKPPGYVTNYIDSASHPFGVGKMKTGFGKKAKTWFVPFADKRVHECVGKTMKSINNVCHT